MKVACDAARGTGARELILDLRLHEIHRWWSTVKQISTILKQKTIDIVIGWM